jgi:hypothetical protein
MQDAKPLNYLATGVSSLPIMTAQAFASLNHLPIGVVEAQMDRRHLPVFRVAKRRFINLEALRLIAAQSHQALV